MNFFRKFLLVPLLCFGATLLLVFSSGLNAQGQKTFDGHWWNELPSEFRIGFILGYQEGFKMALGELVARNKDLPGSLENLSSKNLEDQFRTGSTFTCGQIADELDKLYKEDANKPLYIYSAITVALMKLHQDPEETIREAITQYRNAKDRFEKKSAPEGKLP